MAIFASVSFVSFRPNLPPPPPRCPVKRGQQSLPAYRHGTCRGNALFAPQRPLTLSRRPDDFRYLVFQSQAGDDGGESHEDEEAAAAENKSGEEGKQRPTIKWLRQAMQSVLQHSGRIFVVAMAGIIRGPYILTFLRDISVLHCLGLKIVIIPGADELLEWSLIQNGHESKRAGALRILDPACVELAETEIKKVVLGIATTFSRVFQVPVSVGDFFVAERRSGLEFSDYDFGATGYVSEVKGSEILEKLDSVVLIHHIGYSASRELLYCDIYELATSCALAVGADKLIHLDLLPYGEEVVKPVIDLPVNGDFPVYKVQGIGDGALMKLLFMKN